MKKICILITVVLSFTFSMYGQTGNKHLPSITRPSPTVAQLMKVEESSLDHYTGQPQISVPLFSATAGNLEVGLTLSYNSSGIRTSEQSGWVGKGWSLETGGVISRSVIDLPDEIETDNHKGTNSMANKFHNIFNLPDDSEERKEFIYDAQWGKRISYDTKTDIYQFSFFGRTGRFSFTKVGGVGNLVPVIIGNDGNYKIEATYTTNPLPTMYPKEITTFVITDDTGNKYYFSELERTIRKDMSLTYMQEGCDEPVAPSHAPTIQKFITAWHLTKVEDANGIRLLDISYVKRFEKPNKTETRIDNIPENIHSISVNDSEDCTKHMRCALEPRTIITESSREIETKRISRISFPDETSIRFTNTMTHPEYGGTGSLLTKIEIFNTKDTLAVPTRYFDFIYPSTVSGTLFLDGIKINGSDTERYAFDYYKRELYPGYSAPEERDIFGYALFEPTYDAERTGVLTKISYPTKGVREFEWEPNTYSFQGDRLLTFKEIFKNTDNYTEAPVGVTDPYMNQGNPIGLRPYSTFYVKVEQDATTFVSTSANGQIDEMMPNAVYIVPIISETDLTVDSGRPELGFPISTGQHIQTTVHLLPGAYKVYMWSGNLSENYVKISGLVQIYVKTPKPHLNWFLYGGGLRIKGIKDRDRGADQIVKGFAYNFENPGILPADLPPYPYLGGGTFTLSFSSGSFDGSQNLVREYWTKIEPIFNLPPLYNYLPTDMNYHVFERQSELDAQLQKGSFIGYKNVFEFFYPNNPTPSLPLYKSKIKYVFDSPIDFPSSITTSSPPLPIRGDEYKQSNVRKIEYYGSTLGLLATEDFKYNYDTQDIKKFVKKNLYFITNAANISGFCQQVRVMYASYWNLKNNIVTGDYYTDCSGGISSLVSSFRIRDKSTCVQSLTVNYMSVDDFRYRSQMVESTKKEYFPAGTVETKETFTYRNENKRLFSQSTYLASGQHIENRYYYPDDPEMSAINTPFKADLIARHMTGIQLRTENYRNGSLLSTQETRYGMFSPPSAPPAVGGNTLLPQSIYTSKAEQPLEKKVSFDSYDNRTNLTQYTPDGGAPVSVIWGYKNSLPVAKIENMAHSALPSALVTQIQEATHAQLPVKLEELRTHSALTGAMLSAYTYKTLVGNETEIDPKGAKTSYKYDQFGRLEEVRDAQGNLISHNRYQYRQN
ncbi:RHS repeat domain-containing protein [Sphingobacterium siyangense]|uniref:RHS repeat domain-containing protein n=1 Tax=Sphingobacterium siyangense TaxID=459529 RepID=UPI003DA32F20